MDITYVNKISVEDYNMLHEAVGWGMCKVDRVKTALARSDYLIVAHSGEDAAGMARVMHDGLQALIMDVIVSPEYQGQGIGGHMMKCVMEYLYSVARDGDLFVSLMSALGKDDFYAKFGFERRPNEARGPGMTQTLKSNSH